MLSEAELDDALELLYRPVDPTAEDLARLRSLVVAAPTPTRSPRVRGRRVLLAAAVVGGLVAGGLLVPSWLGGPGVNPAVAAELSTAADAIGTDSVPVGMYRYVDTHVWSLTTSVYASLGGDGATYTLLVESRQEQWIPARWEDDWMERRSTTGDVVFVSGDEDAARAAGALDRPAGVEPDLVGPCQSYFSDVCTGTDGDWTVPTTEWIDGLPTDAAALFDRLAADASGRGQSDEAEMLVLASDALRTGLLPRRPGRPCTAPWP